MRRVVQLTLDSTEARVLLGALAGQRLLLSTPAPLAEIERAWAALVPDPEVRGRLSCVWWAAFEALAAGVPTPADAQAAAALLERWERHLQAFVAEGP